MHYIKYGGENSLIHILSLFDRVILTRINPDTMQKRTEFVYGN